jgi:hypothetical protein
MRPSRKGASVVSFEGSNGRQNLGDGAHLVAYVPEFSLPGVSPDLLRRPEGTIAFPAKYPGLHEDVVSANTLFEIVAGAHLFRLRRDPDKTIRAVHASPGGGTYVAAVNLAPLAPSDEIVVILRWTPETLDLDVSAGSARLHAQGLPSDIRVTVDAEGNVYEFGPALAGVRVCADGVMMVSPPAIELWAETAFAVGVLLTGSSPSRDFASIAANSCLAMLVTGFEAYCQQRFLEIEKEGVPPDVKSCLARLGRADEKVLIRNGTFNAVPDARGDFAAALAKRVNFQNYESARDAFRLAYGVRFKDLGISSYLAGRLKKLIRYRHRIVHVSPALVLLNQAEVPPEQPEESSVALAKEAVSVFDRYIRALHTATLRLRPPL